MNDSKDISRLLEEWPYDEEDNVRFLTGADGRDLMQIREPLGIEQYDLDGRPDGRKPEGEDSMLALYLKKEKAALESGDEWELKDDDFTRLHTEGVLFYYRYLALFQVGQYDRVVRDTEHNLAIIRLLLKYYQGEQSREMLQYRPYIRRMNAISRAMLRLSEDDTDGAMSELENGKADIESNPAVPTPIYEFEKIRSLQHLTQVIAQVAEAREERQKPPGFRERLTEELSRAVENEDYERAARIRDRIRRLD